MSPADAVILGVIGAALAVVAAEPQSAASSRLDAGAEVGVSLITAGTARRRSPATLVWTPLRSGDPVYEGDSLFVEAGGLAEISFFDGAHLQIAQHSLIVVDNAWSGAAEPPAVSLRRGTLTGSAGGTGLNINLGRAVARLTQGQANLVAGAGSDPETSPAEAGIEAGIEADVEDAIEPDIEAGGARIEVLDGQVELANEGAIVQLPPRHVAAVGRDGTARAARALRADLVAPQAGQRTYFVTSPGAIALRWEAASVDGLRAQIARRHDFARTVAEGGAGAREVGFTPPAAGAYWWRVVDRDGAAVSETRTFLVLPDVPPELYYPIADEVVIAPRRRVPLVWSAVNGVRRYFIEIARDESFRDVAWTGRSHAPQFFIDSELDDGTYYWRVRSDDAERGASPFSRPSLFRLSARPVLPAPELGEAQLQVGGDDPPR